MTIRLAWWNDDFLVMFVLSRYEVARLVGLRALQLAEGAPSVVKVHHDRLRYDFVYVAALELYEKKLDVCVMRADVAMHVSGATFPPDLATMLNSSDAGTRDSQASDTGPGWMSPTICSAPPSLSPPRL